MGKQADFQPRWLVSLMCQWARRIASEENGGLGYPKKAAFLTIGFSKSAKTDPTEFSAKDYSDLNAALAYLCENEFPRWAAMMMYYKPWVIPAFQAEGWPFGNQTYYNRLHAAHLIVSQHIDANKPRPIASLPELEYIA